MTGKEINYDLCGGISRSEKASIGTLGNTFSRVFATLVKQFVKKGDIQMLTAGDFMTKKVISVRKETPIYDALELLRKNDITGMPVVEDDMILIGVITEKDVLKLFFTDGDYQDKTVDTFMTRPAASFGVEESLDSVCDFLMVKSFRRVPVVTVKGKLVGIISRPDIIDNIIVQRHMHVMEHKETELISPVT
jgi:CBS domain-containing protein